MAISGNADVTVIGAGIFGLACAWACQQRGARVHVFDQKAIGAGSSGGIVGALAPHVPENWNAKKAFQLNSLLMAKAFWADVAKQSGVDPGYAQSGRIQPLPDAAAVAMARSRVAGAQTHWQGSAAWRVISAQNDGWIPAAESGFCIEDTLSARIHPRQATAALAAAICAKGGVVEAGTSELPAEVFLNRRNAGAVIWATGVQGLAQMSADLGKTVGGGVKGQAALLAFDARDRPQIFAGGIHIVPHGDGTVAIGSTSERDYETAQGTDMRLETLIDRARAICPALTAAPVVERWAGVRPRAKSRAPMLGEWPGRPGHFIANGGFKIGFGMAPKVADIMADLVLEAKDRIPDGFRVCDSL